MREDRKDCKDRKDRKEPLGLLARRGKQAHRGKCEFLTYQDTFMVVAGK